MKQGQTKGVKKRINKRIYFAAEDAKVAFAKEVGKKSELLYCTIRKISWFGCC